MIEEMLTYSANFFSISTEQNSLGTEKKTRIPLYSNVPCRLLQVRSGWSPNIGESEGTKEKFKIVCGKLYDKGKGGDQIDVDDKTYTISRRHIQRDETGTNHVVYFLLEFV